MAASYEHMPGVEEATKAAITFQNNSYFKAFCFVYFAKFLPI